MTEYTPSTEEVREQYWAASGDPRRDSQAWGEFDRWLRKVQAEAWDEGADAAVHGYELPDASDIQNPYLQPT